MNVRDYEYIISVAENGSISNAAASLFITQPALTKFLKRVEIQLGVELFIRKGNQLVLTEMGERYVNTGREIVKLDRGLTQDIENAIDIQKNHIKIGYGMGRSSYMIKKVLPQFYKKYPNVKVITKAESSILQMKHLEEHKIDLALVVGMEVKQGYEFRDVDKSSLVLAVPDNSDLIKKASKIDGYLYPVISKEQWKDSLLISMSPETNSGNMLREYLKRNDINAKIVLEVTNTRSVFEAIEQGLGVAILYSVPKVWNNITYLSLLESEMLETKVSVVTKSDKHINKYISYMIELLSNTKIN